MTTRKEKAASTRRAIKDAARRLLAERGFLNTRITDITAEAGRSTGSFYEHFTDKDDLLRELMADMTKDVSETMGTDPHPADHDLTDRAELRRHIAAAWMMISGNLPVVVGAFQSRMTRPLADGEPWRELTADTDMLRQHLEHLANDGHRLPGDPKLVAAVMGTIFPMLGYSLLTDPTASVEYDNDTVIDTITDLLLHGLAGPHR